MTKNDVEFLSVFVIVLDHVTPDLPHHNKRLNIYVNVGCAVLETSTPVIKCNREKIKQLSGEFIWHLSANKSTLKCQILLDFKVRWLIFKTEHDWVINNY